MPRIYKKTQWIICTLALIATVLSGQALVLAPADPSANLATSVQFTAALNGTPASAVVWSVAGVIGGNVTLGTISSSGFFTAPATLPAMASERIAASAGSASAHTTLKLVQPPAVVTAVSPNPLPSGTFTVTVQASGLLPGATVFDGAVQLTTLSATANSVTATGYQAPAASTTFCVKNPGLACGGKLSVAVVKPQSGGSGGTGGGGSGSSGSGGGGSAAPAAPVLTAVAPSPVAVSTITVTVQGSGFLPGALLYDSYGSNVLIQYPASSVTPNSLTATIYQGPAPTSTFSVKNPGSAYSNAIAVVVSSGSDSGTGGSTGGTGGGTPSTYTLNVVGGTIQGGGASGSFAADAAVTLVANTAPAGQFFQNWSGASVTSPNATQTGLTMPAANATVTANFGAAVPLPFPVTTHPRLWITQQDLPRLQSWATPSNPSYQALLGTLSTALANYQTAFPGTALTDHNPVAANPYPDLGDTQGYTGLISEENAVILAFNSLLDPNPSNRAAYAQAARNLVMYAMNQAVLGPASNLPFRDPQFAIYNRTGLGGNDWPLTVDWIYNTTDMQGNPILTASDKATIRNVFMMWANACLNASTTGGDHPAGPIGGLDLAGLLPNNLPYRMASNNYYLAHARLLTMMSLALDPNDDPPVNPAVAPSQIGNTLRSYISDATGAWLAEEYAMMGDPAAVAQAFNFSSNPGGAGLGLASGGLPPEGMLYGESFGYVLSQLLALQTAGYNDPALSGPQVQLASAPVWDRYVKGYLSSLTPTAKLPASETYLGPVYQFAGYGDMLRLWVTPDTMQAFSLLALLEQENGQSTHLNAARWFSVNAMPGGAASLPSRISDPWSWGVTPSILYYLLLDPNAAPATDPRPQYPLYFYDAPAARVVAHSDWSPAGTMFDYRASWISINHQDATGGMFEFFRNGEWLTKEMSNYDNNWMGETAAFHNTLSIQNACSCASNPPDFLSWFETNLWNQGSQWLEGLTLGDPASQSSHGPGYVFASSDLTNLYNRQPGATGTIANVTQANRSILWLNNDYIVVYDRATTQAGGLFKRFNLSLVTAPQVNGATATETLPSGQQLFIQTLLPQNATFSTINGAALLNPIADLEPTSYVYTVQDPSLPADTRFLHVLQGADAGAAQVPATYLQSASGTAFDGAAFGASVVYFPVSATAAFTGTVVTAPAGAHSVILTGLAPNAGFAVAVQNAAGGATLTVTPNGTAATSDAAGVLVINY